MEGNRHERSLLIAVSYIIGFVTAFIFYQDKLNKTEAYNNPSYSTVVAINKNQTLQKTPDNDTKNSSDYDIKNKTLSRGEKIDEAESGRILDTLSITSNDGLFSFFCKPASAEGLCKAYILDIKNSLSYPVILENNDLLISDSLISDIKWNNNYLKIGDFISVSDEKPWLLHELILR